MENVRDEPGERGPFDRHGRERPRRTAADGGFGGEGLGIFIRRMQRAANLVEVLVVLLAEVVVEHDRRAGEDEHQEGEKRGPPSGRPRGVPLRARRGRPGSQLLMFQGQTKRKF